MEKGLPLKTAALLLTLLFIGVWFFTGGSFRLYASIFFLLYSLTNQIWLSVILVGIAQNIIFLPLRHLALKYTTSIKELEQTLEETKTEEQYLVFKEKVRYGDSSVLFYIFTFVIYAIAFLSAGRVFLIDFYNTPLDKSLLYSWVPYPSYPLEGTTFYFPFFKIVETTRIPLQYLLYFWLAIAAIFIIPRFLWGYVRPYLTHNLDILKLRIKINRVLFFFGGFLVTAGLFSIFLAHNFPINFNLWILTLDLTRQSTSMNTITAVATFLTIIHAGYSDNKLLYKEGKLAGISQILLDQVFKERMRTSVKNAVLLGLGAFFITNQIPSAFELSVATFELLIFLSPYTFDKFLLSRKQMASS